MKRGELWWAALDKRRPVLLLSRDEAYAVRQRFVVAPLSTSIRGYSAEVRVGRAEGLPKKCVVNCDWLMTISKPRLERRISELTRTKMEAVDEILLFALGLDAYALGRM